MRQGVAPGRQAKTAGRRITAKPAQKRRPPARRLSAEMRHVAGVDEAGRGPLAGPVVAAAVILDINRVPKGIDDSKLLTPERREELFEAILATSIVSFAAASPAEIDRINIRQATLGAMARAVLGLPQPPLRVLVDGCDTPAIPFPAEAIVDGDAKSVSIAAASIVAKVARDRIMRRLARAHPDYGFDSHKGYSTPFHLDALLRLGPCRAHRMSFAPCAQAAFALTG